MVSVALLLLLAAGSCVKCEQLTQPASVTVQPGQRLTITCQVSYSVSSYYTAWIRQPAGKGLEWIGIARAGQTTYYKDSLRNKFSMDLSASSNTATLNGQNMQPEDTAVYYCARERGPYHAFDYWGKGTMVTVTSATSQAPTHVLGLQECGVDSSNTVTLGCLATGFTPSSVSFTWTQNGTDLTDSVQYPPVQNNGLYSAVSQIKVKRQDWSIGHPFKCAVKHGAGTPRTVQINLPVVVYQLPTLKVGFSDEGNEVSFSCFAKDFTPRDHDIKWLRNGEVFTNKQETQAVSKGREENGTTLYSAASFLSVPPTERSDDITFTCVFEGKGPNGIMTSVNSSVAQKNPDIALNGGDCHWADVKVNIIEPTPADLLVNRKGTVICQIDILRGQAEKVNWVNEQGVDMATASLKNKKGKFNLTLDITYDEWNRGVKRYCVVEHNDWFEPLKTLYEKRNGGQPQRPSVFMLAPVEHTRTEEVTLTCFVKDFFPKDVFVSWLVDDDDADSNKFRTTNPVEKDGSYYAYGHLTVPLDQWKKKDVGYSCVVYHESLVNATKSIVRSIAHSTLENTNLINLNINDPQTCRTQ